MKISSAASSWLLFLSLTSTADPSFAFTATTFARTTVGGRSQFRPLASSSSERTTTATSTPSVSPSWQAKLETLLDPVTPLPQRQTLLSEILTANQEIRESVLEALRDRKIDPLLTPTTKKWQDGTRAVARQLATDIFPDMLVPRRTSSPSDIQRLVPKVGAKVLGAISNQVANAVDDLQNDLADPSRRIPQRLTQQTEDLVQEARNVFLETPEGLQGPEYTVVQQLVGPGGVSTEIRDYEGYTVASTAMGKFGEPASADIATGGAAFNALAAYLFGGNSKGRMMEMTTPVTTTSFGEMRFCLPREMEGGFPEPIQQENEFETGAVQVVEIPPARLAVRKFTGFVTEGEIARQKEALLETLTMNGSEEEDGVSYELDIEHGAAIPYLVFQYNPPYTIPIVRRNEIAVPIRKTVEVDLKAEWGSEKV